MASDLNVGMKCIKYMLLTINAMFVLTATLILSIGTTIYALYHDIQNFVHDSYFSPAALLIAIGIIMLVVSVFGCIGAAKESTFLINVFALLLFGVFILEISAAFAAYTTVGGVSEYVGEKFNESIHIYTQNEEIKAEIDLVQEKLECCGVYDKTEWLNTEWYSKQENKSITYPESCFGGNIVEDYIDNGCLQHLSYIITQSTVLLGTGAITIAFVQFVGILFSLMLAKAIRQAKTERERRRWEIREKVLNAYCEMEVSLNQKSPQNGTTPVVYVPSVGYSRA